MIEGPNRRTDWSREEVSATVADYFQMLDLELRGQAYNKAEHNRQLAANLTGRSRQAIEFKHANISAILIELGFPYINGYKPRGNYQELLKEETVARLEHSYDLQAITRALVEGPAIVPGVVPTINDVFVPPPIRDGNARPRTSASPTSSRPRRVNFLEIEARNASLGAAGEAFVLEVEHQRLWESGARRLAEKIEHVSRTQGDGLGYDVLSFEKTGEERLIEVKTTNFGSMTPFFASAHEVSFSEERHETFHLYRVFDYKDTPRIFTLQGSIRESCVLDAVQFRARVQ